MTKEADEFLKVEGKTYRRRKDGSLAPYRTEAEIASDLSKQITAGHTVTGLRLTNASNPDADAIVVTFTKDEATAVVKAVKDILDKRAKG